jgi:hypothetical protein
LYKIRTVFVEPTVENCFTRARDKSEDEAEIVHRADNRTEHLATPD